MGFLPPRVRGRKRRVAACQEADLLATGTIVRSRRAWWALLVVMACGGGEEAPPAQAPSVGVVVALEKPIVAETRLAGTLRSFNAVDLVARIEGRIEARTFVEGEMVEEGQVLYRIEDDRYAAEVARWAAHVEQARAREDAASREYGRYSGLLDERATTEQIVDQRLDDLQAARAEVAAAKANLQSAQVDLDNTVIRAPISGRIGQAIADRGQLVKPGAPPVLARITRIDPIFVHVPLDERRYLRFQKRRTEHEEHGLPLPTVRLRLSDGSLYPELGELDYVSPAQEEPGFFDLRARFPNEDQLLRPGQFGELLLSSPDVIERVVVPQEAVARRQTGDEVRVVGDDGVVEIRKVELGAEIGPLWEVREGLAAGEKVVVSGQFKAQEGSVVVPREMPMPEVPVEALPQGLGEASAGEPGISEILEGGP